MLGLWRKGRLSGVHEGRICVVPHESVQRCAGKEWIGVYQGYLKGKMGEERGKLVLKRNKENPDFGVQY